MFYINYSINQMIKSNLKSADRNIHRLRNKQLNASPRHTLIHYSYVNINSI